MARVAKKSFEENLHRVLTRHIPGCQGLVSAERLSSGASQETYRLLVTTDQGDTQLALRRAAGGAPPDPQRPGLDVEALLMQSAKSVGVPEPEVHYVLTKQDGLGSGFIMEWLPGETLGGRIVRAPEFAELRPKLARECGRILAKIHSIDLEQTGLRQKLRELPPGDFIKQTWERYRLLETPQPMIDYAARWLLAHLPQHYEARLVHNDFRNGNLILSPHGVVAVLDWEVAHIGDPMRDLGWLCTNSWRFGGALPVGGFGTREDLFQGYAEESGITVDPKHVRFWEVFGSFWWAVGCLGMAQQYRTGPDATVERPAIGRRSSECQVDCANLLLPGAVELGSGSPGFTSLELPRMNELILSVRDFLRQDLLTATDGRTRFLARVASNSLDIVLRELTHGPEYQRRELARLRALYQSGDSLTALRWRLVHELREGDWFDRALFQQELADNEPLTNHLRQTVAGQLAIDQPGYSGLKTARTAGRAPAAARNKAPAAARNKNS